MKMTAAGLGFLARRSRSTDGGWVAAARRGDERAAAALVARYGPPLRRAVAYWTRDADTADDVCQEAWLRAFRALPTFRGEADFGTWLHSIARNVCVGWARTAGRREDLLGLHRPPAEAPPEPIELRVDLQRAVDALPPGMRDVLWMHDVEGLKHAEVAAVLGITEGTSKSQLFKARAHMRRSLTSRRGTGRDPGGAAWAGAQPAALMTRST